MEIYCIFNIHLKPILEEKYTEACKVHDIPAIRLAGINKTWGHPAVLGMKQIKEQVLSAIGE